MASQSKPPAATVSNGHGPDSNEEMFDSEDDEIFAAVCSDEFYIGGPTSSKRQKIEDPCDNEPLLVAADNFNHEIKKADVNADLLNNQPIGQIKVIVPDLKCAVSVDAGVDVFDDDEDAFLCEIAGVAEDAELLLKDIEEEGWVEEDGVEEENRFKTRIGRPHPLLMPQVLTVVFNNISCGATLKSCRQVCTVWKDLVTPIAFQYLTLRNANHAVEKYPYGLGFVEGIFNCPYPVPVITRIRIADPCVVFSKNEVHAFFDAIGKRLKYFGFDANLYCKDQIDFLKNVVFSWCKDSLEELELIDVGNFDFIDEYSGITVRNSNIEQQLCLKRLKIRGSSSSVFEQEYRHHHFSTVSKSLPPRLRTYNTFNLFGLDALFFRRKGFLQQIMESCPLLESVIINGDFLVPKTSFGALSVRIMNQFMAQAEGTVAFSRNLNELVLSLENHTISRNDVLAIKHCFFPLKKLVLGIISNRVTTRLFQSLLANVSETLQVLEIGGVQPDNVPGKLRIFRFNVLVIKTLKVLVIGDGCRLRPEDVQAMSGLEELVIKCMPIPARHCEVVMKYLNRFVDKILRNLPALEKVVLESCRGVWFKHDFIIKGLSSFPDRQEGMSLSLDYTLQEALDFVPEFYSKGGGFGLQELQLKFFKGDWKGGSWVDLNENIKVWPGLRSLRVTNLSEIWLVLKLKQITEMVKQSVGFYSLEFTGFMIYDFEAENIARYLVEHVNSVRFTNCIIVKKGYENLQKSLVLEGKKQFRRFKEIEINRVNVSMNVKKLFQVL